MRTPTDQHQYNLQTQKPSSYDFSAGSDESAYERQQVELEEQLRKIQYLREQESQRQREEEEMIAKVEDVDLEINQLSQELQAALTSLDSELAANKNELGLLTHGRETLSVQLEKISAVNPKEWSRDSFNMELDRAYAAVSAVEQQMDSIEQDLQATRLGGEKLYKANVKGTARGADSAFMQGFVSNLPTAIAVLILAYIVYTKL